VNELPAPACECADSARGVVGVIGDHINHNVVMFARERLLKGGVVFAVARDDFRAFGQAVLALAPVEQGHLMVLF